MTRPLTPEEARDPGVALARLLGMAGVRRLAEEEVSTGLALITAVRLEMVEDTYRRAGKLVDRVATGRAA